jgi:prevent-host-death family protein
MSDHMKRQPRRAAKQESVGVRELKTHAARIVRGVREEHASYVVTHRGTPVGVILPLVSGEAPPVADARRDSPWTAFLAAGRRIGPRFRAGVSGVRVLSESRR